MDLVRNLGSDETHKKTNILWKGGRKEGQEDYSKSVGTILTNDAPYFLE